MGERCSPFRKHTVQPRIIWHHVRVTSKLAQRPSVSVHAKVVVLLLPSCHGISGVSRSPPTFAYRFLGRSVDLCECGSCVMLDRVGLTLLVLLGLGPTGDSRCLGSGYGEACCCTGLVCLIRSVGFLHHGCRVARRLIDLLARCSGKSCSRCSCRSTANCPRYQLVNCRRRMLIVPRGVDSIEAD